MALILVPALLLVALLLWWLAGRSQKQSGLPPSPIHYDDSGAGERRERALVSHRYRLTGRPDYLLEIDGHLIPVEVKPNRRANRPYESDLMQLAAYCLLVEERYGNAPPYGIVKYAEKSWEIPYTDALRNRLLETLKHMRDAHLLSEVPRQHNYPNRCSSCGVLAYCDQHLLP